MLRRCDSVMPGNVPSIRCVLGIGHDGMHKAGRYTWLKKGERGCAPVANPSLGIGIFLVNEITAKLTVTYDHLDASAYLVKFQILDLAVRFNRRLTSFESFLNSVHYNSHRGLIDHSGQVKQTPPRAFLAQEMPILSAGIEFRDVRYKACMIWHYGKVSGYVMGQHAREALVHREVLPDVSSTRPHGWNPPPVWPVSAHPTTIDEMAGPEFKGEWEWRNPPPSSPAGTIGPFVYPKDGGDCPPPEQIEPDFIETPTGYVPNPKSSMRVMLQKLYADRSPFDPEELCADMNRHHPLRVNEQNWTVPKFIQKPCATGYEVVPNPEYEKAPYEMDKDGIIRPRTLVNETGPNDA